VDSDEVGGVYMCVCDLEAGGLKFSPRCFRRRLGVGMRRRCMACLWADGALRGPVPAGPVTGFPRSLVPMPELHDPDVRVALADPPTKVSISQAPRRRAVRPSRRARTEIHRIKPHKERFVGGPVRAAL
jgi:hypothetical protein